MTELLLLRIRSTGNPQYGILKKDESLVCLTLELPNFNNAKYISSIPVGTYQISRTTGRETTGGMKLKTTYVVTGVPGRTGILFHPGNSAKDTKGCILVGLGIDGTQKDPTLTRSLDGFQRFLEALRGCEQATLRVCEI